MYYSLFTIDLVSFLHTRPTPPSAVLIVRNDRMDVDDDDAFLYGDEGETAAPTGATAAPAAAAPTNQTTTGGTKPAGPASGLSDAMAA